VQHPGDVAPKGFGSGSIKPTATMGKPIGANKEHPQQFLRKHAKEPVLPARGCPQ
jgi:hypothetical protein